MRTHFDTEARIAVAQAADIARELGHREVGPGHLLTALLANPRGAAHAALRDRGLDYDTARDRVAEHHVDAEPATPDQDDRYADDREALEAIGVDLERVREAVRANLGDDLADGWGARHGRHHHHHHHHHHHGGGRRYGRRGSEERGSDERGSDERGSDERGSDERRSGRGRGRRGPRSRREGLRFSPGLRAVLRDARHGSGLTGPGLLEALTRSDDPAAQAVLGTALQ